MRAETAWLRGQQLQLLYDQAPLAHLISSALGLITAFVLRDHAPRASLIAWAGAVLTITTLRAFLAHGFHRAQQRGEIDQRWARWYREGTLAAGLIWGSSALLLYPEGWIPGQVFLAFVLGGLCTGAVTALAALPAAYLSFTLPILIPMAVRLLLTGDFLHLAMGSFYILFALGLTYATWHLHTVLMRSLQLRHENRGLVQQLTAANQELEEEVIQRREMVDKVRQRDAILEAVAYAASRLLPDHSWRTAGPEIFRQLGEATRVSRVYLFAMEGADSGKPEDGHLRQVLEWVAPGIEPQIDNPELQHLPAAAPGLWEWSEQLAHGEIVAGLPPDFNAEQQDLLESQGILSIVMVPVFVSGRWWGFMGFDDCEMPRPWSPVETEALRAAADTVGAAIQGERAEEALRESEERYRLLAENTHDMVGLHQPDGELLYITPSSYPLLGFAPEELLGTNPYDLLHPEDHARVLSTSHRPVLEGHCVAPITYRMRTRSGDYIWLESVTQAIRDPAGAIVRLVTSSRDISLRKQAEEQLLHEKELAQITLHSIGDGVITTDGAGCVQTLNLMAEELLQMDQDEGVGRPLDEIFELEDEVFDRPIDDLVARILHPEEGLEELPDHAFLRSPEGERFAVQLTATPIRNRHDATVGCVIVFRDVSQNRELAQQLSYQATHDSLTGLINRRELEARLHHSLLHGGKREIPDVLCYIDLDQFKVVNDTCGHVAGDELLRQLTRLLQSKARPEDSVARLGGDEFGILLAHCPLEEALRLGKEICRQIREVRFTWEDKVFTVGASIGMVEIASQMKDVAGVLKAADTACYEAKDRGRNRVHVYHSDDLELARRHGEMEWISRIHRALSENRLELSFQPILSTRASDRNYRRIEILLSMRDSKGNRIPPGSFIPAAEHYNLMPTLDRWVVRNTLSGLAPHWRTYPDCEIKTCFINLSSTSMADPAFLEFLTSHLAALRIPQGAVCFEITETAAITNLSDALHFIEEIRRFGCYFALDDFGSGLSSFAHLKAMPVDYLKIDGSFVRDLIRDATDRALVESINRIGHLLGLQTIAESVESEELLARVTSLDIDFAQGFAIARPAPLKGLLARLEGAREGHEDAAHTNVLAYPGRRQENSG